MADCILWPGRTMAGGYGAGPRGVLAHRHVYAEHFGPIPEGYCIHHTCEVRLCVNPEHLEAMPRADHSRLHDNPRKAREARRAATHCKRGHPFNEANTAWPLGRRRCCVCDREAHRARYVPKALR